jgi:branched-chain amino acid aminotransferase
VDLPKHAYFQGKIVPYSEAKVGVATHALNYGTGVFGGMRAYWNEEKEMLFIFRPQDHFRRFLNSCRMMCMEFTHTPESLTAILLDLLHKDGYREDIYIRPLAYKADEVIGVRLHDLKDELTMFAMPIGQYVKNDTNAHVTISSWRRIDDNMIPARGKISGAYVNSALIKTDAARSGFDEALVLTQDGHITEGSAMNVFLMRDGVLLTAPVTENILEGITRRSVIELAKNELGLTVVERLIDRTEVYISATNCS